MNTEETLQKTPLFKNIKREDVKDVIGALGAKERSYAAGENILREGEKVRCAGVIAEGGAVIESVDFSETSLWCKAFPPVPFCGSVRFTKRRAACRKRDGNG